MFRKVEEFESELSSIHEPFAIRTGRAGRLNDSLNSTFFPPNGSDLSFMSLNSALEESFAYKNSCVKAPNSAKCTSLRPNRPVNVLTTFFLPGDLGIPETRRTESKSENRIKLNESSRNYRNERSERNRKTEEEKIRGLERENLKKDGIIEGLREKINKLNEDIEVLKTELRNSEAKAWELGKQESDREVKRLIDKENELLRLLEVNENEIRELKNERSIYRSNREGDLYRKLSIEAELKNAREEKELAFRENEMLAKKIDSLAKALDSAVRQKSFLEQEVFKNDLAKKKYESDLKAAQENSSSCLTALTEKLQQAQGESKNYQSLLKESQMNYESLTASYNTLKTQLQKLESQFVEIDNCFPVKQTSSSKPFCENCSPKEPKKSTCQKNILREVQLYLNLPDPHDLLPRIKSLMSEKKTAQKISKILKSNFGESESASKLLKKVLQDYKILTKNLGTNDFSSLRTCLGELNWRDKIVTLAQEHKILREILAKLRMKLSLPLDSTVSDIELAINSIR